MRFLYHIPILITFIITVGSPVQVQCASEKPTDAIDQIIILKSKEDSSDDQKSGLPENLSVKGFVMLKGASDIENDAPSEQDKTFRNRVRLEGKWEPGKKTSAPSDTSGFNYYILASIESDYLWFGPDNVWDDYSLDLYEGYFFGLKDRFEFTIGKQIVRWGKTDQISPVDNLNPQDLRQFIVPEYEDRKIPNWMVRPRFFLKPYTMEGVYIPFFEPADFTYFGTDWSIFDHLKENVKNAPLSPDVKQFIENLRVDQEEPTDTFENGQWGVRVSRNVSGWDMGLSYLYAWETLPFYESFPIKNISVQGSTSLENLIKVLPGAVFEDDPVIRTTFKRSNIIGFEFETTVRDFGIRGEAAYYDNQSFLTNTITSTRKPVFHYVVGADYFWHGDWYINLQFSHQIIFDYDPEIFFFNRDNTALVGEISKEFWDGYFKALLRYDIGLSEQSYYVSPELMCKYIPNLDISLGFNFFEGDSDTLIGFYGANDQVFLKLKYYF